MGKDFLERQKVILNRRREAKLRILKEGGEQALSHSYRDIARIDFALKRIQEGQYGLYTNCGVPIEDERLQIIPETPFCARCAKRTAH